MNKYEQVKELQTRLNAKDRKVVEDLVALLKDAGMELWNVDNDLEGSADYEDGSAKELRRLLKRIRNTVFPPKGKK
jgi:hypothetical protein